MPVPARRWRARAFRCGRQGALATVLMAVVWLAVAAPAAAHVKSTYGYSLVRTTGGTVQYELRLEFDVLARSAGLGAAAVDADSDSARSAALRDAHQVVAAYLTGRVDVYLDDVACAGDLAGTGVEGRDGVPYAVLDLSYACPGSPDGSYRVDYRVFDESEGMVDDHVNVVEYDLGGERGRVVLNAGQRDFVAGERSAWSWLTRFVRLGVEHILAGADHVLFVAVLLLGAASLGEVAKVVSMFTLAHSVTLGLAVLGWVRVPTQIVEPLIALSIVYVAVENVLRQETRHRLVVVFGFGLMHGLGFASALRFTDQLSWGLVGSLAGFNAGIELGQALLVVVLFPLLAGVRRLRWSTPVQLGVTGIIAVLGLVWFAQRVAFG